MAKTRAKGRTAGTPKKALHSSTRRERKVKSTPVDTHGCCPDCVGKASGTMGACEDDTCRDIPPPQGTGPWVLYVKADVNGGFPYWERVANVIAASTAKTLP